MRKIVLVLALASLSSPAWADFCMLTQNTLRLGHGKPAYQSAKRDGFKAIFKDYDVVSLQEVMDPVEAARLAPPGFTATVSTAKGHSTYREHYAVLTRDAVMRVLDRADYPDHGGDFARPPFGVAVEDKDKGRYWLVGIHTVFGRHGVEPRRLEVAAMAEVSDFYARRALVDGSVVPRVIIAGDWNLPTTDEAFDALDEAGLMAAPNVLTSLNVRGEYASAYDHFAWDSKLVSVDFAEEPREVGGLPLEEFRHSLSDHAGVAGYVLSRVGRARPKDVHCPPARVGVGS